MSNIKQALQDRILILDGAMGTMLQAYKFSEDDFRGEIALKITLYPCRAITTYYPLRNRKLLKLVHGKIL